LNGNCRSSRNYVSLVFTLSSLGDGGDKGGKLVLAGRSLKQVLVT
jgi:hypothetical protein